MSQFAYLATKLDSMPEGDGTVLDNSCLMFLSSLFVGRTHDNTRLPVVLAGGLGGTLKTGRSLNYLGEPAENRKMCSLYLSLMDRMGVKLDHLRRRRLAPGTYITQRVRRRRSGFCRLMCVTPSVPEMLSTCRRRTDVSI
jgi:hypothetical protein